MRPLPILCAALVGLALAGCGSSSGGAQPGASRPARSGVAGATLALDFTPNAVHTGIYEAIARHDDVRAGVRLHIVVPSASTDSIRLLDTGRANFALLDIHDLAIARERGQDIRGIMALVQRPLAAVIAVPGVTDPRQLEGRTAGVTGLPSDTAVLRSVVAGAGGAPRAVHTITIGFNAVADLVARRVAAATAFWNDEGVTIRRRAPGFHVFRVDQFGAPAYPELILCATGASLRTHPGVARAVVRALTAGYEQVLADPAAGLHALTAQVPGLDAGLQAAELRALIPAFREPGGRVGALSADRLNAWADWERKFGIVSRRPDVGAMFDLSLR
jgi:ABC-type nitrate/sulfonate/bicarbonate transport system substrate-binding protein